MFTYTPKRPREKEEQEPEGIPIHEKKKHRSLPLRVSPHTISSVSCSKRDQIAPRVGVSTLTPAESSEDDNDHAQLDANIGEYMSEPWDQEANSVLSAARMSTEMDVDNCNDLGVGLIDESCNDRSQQSPIPPSVVYRSLTISEQQTLHLAHETYPFAIYNTEPLIPQSSTYSGRRDALDDLYNDRNTAWWRDQRLPSPVSDGDAMMINSKDSVSDAEMTYTASRPASPPLGMTGAMLTNMRDLDPSRGFMTAAGTSSKKVAFSMGYRSDCDKCRRKVPGHYSHIIRS
ncbi:uncharacterized protein BO97DRAFT_441029 [Aspergillus homomorphus CBS 101889]|uniref:Uncharacterized protein n=1 Tax=Aspergillus homomorphus (strain CBS 101889) TaxID=1450537 RepID=A0A395I6A3_ASPHC|nr:hypothetical protein BO97DRAFT_441029 [Aspergillus homomorphus CBS 101889]RAL15650.1 hypothetical protein BO97DRAFT_441029 [Aspergillus homomorphus CBS 101889]